MIDLSASIVSSTIATTLLYPAERLKIQMQLDHEDGGFQKSFKKILGENGMKSFYRGITPLIIGNGIAYGVYFVCYQHLKKILHTDASSMLSIMKCSGLAGTIGSIVTNPFYVLQTRQTKSNKSFFEITTALIKEEGYLALWKGLLASLILVSNPIIQFVVYEWLKRYYSKDNQKLNSLIIFVIGAISKIIATIFTYPYTMLRTRQQINSKKSQQYTLWTTFTQVLEKENIKGLFKGLTPKLIQTTLNSALILMIYQKVRRVLYRYVQNK